MATIYHDGTNIPVAPNKDPNSRIDYGFDWSNWLDSANSETISTSTWHLEDTLTYVSDTIDGNITTVMIGGGDVDYTYTITNRVLTSTGRLEDRSMLIRVREK